ncbi:MAG: ABC transporter permease subunit [Ornithinimicrobium sp.]|uniref:ABC transporter permease subunit n=1 Tax=Ornithinimicrobium sp. TaxID=1977084 RepID=UPI003D9BD24E
MSQSTRTRTDDEHLGSEEHLEFRKGTPVWVLAVKWLLLLAVLAGAAFVIQRLIAEGYWLMVVLTAFVALCVVAVYASKGMIPAKYLLPGTVLLLALQIWPLVYTVGISFTNYGSGHLGTKEEAIASIEANSVRQVEGSDRYALNIAVAEGQDPQLGDLVYLLTGPEGTFYAGDIEGLSEPLDAGTVETNPSGRIIEAEGYQTLSASEVNDRSRDLADFAVPTDEGGIKQIGLSEAFIGEPTITYDEASDTMTNQTSGKVYVAGEDAEFVPQDGQGQPLPQGWRTNVGFDNYTDALTDSTLRSGLISVFIWNVVFAVFTVLSTFVLGMLLALLFNDPRLKGKGIYRSLLILPYALPIYVTALIWASMFSTDFGVINEITGLSINWLGDPLWAKVAILMTNLWLGWPYMFIVCTGALQAIPEDVKEAAAIDGAGFWRTVTSVIMPLLLVAVGPLMIASFAFNFNNFGLIFLMTEGGPFTGGQAQIGSTDLLITLAYRLALGGVSPNFGFASAISVFIFILVAIISYQGFKRTAALEDVN